jgi:hypothetical protein
VVLVNSLLCLSLLWAVELSDTWAGWGWRGILCKWRQQVVGSLVVRLPFVTLDRFLSRDVPGPSLLMLLFVPNSLTV